MPALAVADGLFRADDDGVVLLGARCGTCGQPGFPATPHCSYCGAADPDPLPLGRVATLWAFTTVHTAPPGYAGPVPYDFGVVEVPEGLRVVTRLWFPDDHVPAFGEPMQLTTDAVDTTDDGDEVHTWCYVPQEPRP